MRFWQFLISEEILILHFKLKFQSMFSTSTLPFSCSHFSGTSPQQLALGPSQHFSVFLVSVSAPVASCWILPPLEAWPVCSWWETPKLVPSPGKDQLTGTVHIPEATLQLLQRRKEPHAYFLQCGTAQSPALGFPNSLRCAGASPSLAKTVWSHGVRIYKAKLA